MVPDPAVNQHSHHCKAAQLNFFITLCQNFLPTPLACSPRFILPKINILIHRILLQVLEEESTYPLFLLYFGPSTSMTLNSLVPLLKICLPFPFSLKT